MCKLSYQHSLCLFLTVEYKSFFAFRNWEWLHAPTELTKCFDYLVLHILDMLLSRLTDGLTS